MIISHIFYHNKSQTGIKNNKDSDNPIYGIYCTV